MENEIMPAEAVMHQPLSAAQIKAQVQVIQEVMSAVMKEGTHYGVIPGTDKPTLYKAGAEVLLTTFRIALIPEVVDLSTDDAIRYRVMARGVHILTGNVVGVGVGEASTDEEKYRWRSAGRLEWDNTPEDRRRVKYGWKWGRQRGQRVDTETLQVRTNPADLANTVLKMAKKRAQADLCLTSLAASDVFTQEMDEEAVQAVVNDEPPPPPPDPRYESSPLRPSQAPSGKATEKQVAMIARMIENHGIDAAALLGEFGVDTLEALRFEQVNDVLAWIKKQKDARDG